MDSNGDGLKVLLVPKPYRRNARIIEKARKLIFQLGHSFETQMALSPRSSSEQISNSGKQPHVPEIITNNNTLSTPIESICPGEFSEKCSIHEKLEQKDDMETDSEIVKADSDDDDEIKRLLADIELSEEREMWALLQYYRERCRILSSDSSRYKMEEEEEEEEMLMAQWYAEELEHLLLVGKKQYFME